MGSAGGRRLQLCAPPCNVGRASLCMPGGRAGTPGASRAPQRKPASEAWVRDREVAHPLPLRLRAGRNYRSQHPPRGACAAGAEFAQGRRRRRRPQRDPRPVPSTDGGGGGSNKPGPAHRTLQAGSARRCRTARAQVPAGEACPGEMLLPVPGEEPRPPQDSGAGTLSSTEQKPPGEEPAKLDPQRTCPGGLEERGSLTPEPGPGQKGQGRPPKRGQSLELREVFKDVAVYFTREEWELLDNEDKELYRDQMLRNYQALVSLGYQGPTPALICSIQQGKVELLVCDDEGSGKISRSEDLPPRPEVMGLTEYLECGKSFPRSSSLTRHQLINTREKPHQCSKCGKRFNLSSYLTKHQLIHTGEKPHQCLECGKSFRQLSDLARHRLIHTREKPHRCPECGKSFTQFSNLTQHRLIHTVEKPHQCLECGKRFSVSSYLTMHQRIHTGEKPHQCLECGKSFTRSSNLTQHRLIHMVEKPHRCLECGKSFNLSSDMTKHQLIHMQGKPHRCSECGKSFTRLSNLTQHRLIHTGEKPYQCLECGKSFTRSSNLTKHQRIHPREKPHRCSECGKSFTQFRHLAWHQLSHRRKSTCVLTVCKDLPALLKTGPAPVHPLPGAFIILPAMQDLGTSTCLGPTSVCIQANMLVDCHNSSPIVWPI